MAVCLAVMLAGFLVGASASTQAGQHDLSRMEKVVWQVVKEASGIRISIGEWPGSDFIAFRTESVFRGTRQDLMKLITSVDAYREWMTDCEASRLLQRINKHKLIYYVSMNSPWPLSDRDWVNSLEIVANSVSGELMVIYHSVSDFLAEQPGIIRVKNHFAVWHLKPLGEDRFQSIWYAHSEPAGWIPAWMVRLTYDRMILQTTLNMQQWMNRNRSP